MTTKEQELKALAQIKKIVDGLGEDSYIAMAFEGCFEIAEENIQNDWGCSMKQRAESAEKLVSKLEVENINLRHAVKKAQEEASKKQTELEAKVAELESKVLEADDLTDCSQLAFEKECEAEQEAKEAAELIVELAENPTSEEFRQAVKTNRAAREKAEYYKALRTRLAKAQK